MPESFSQQPEQSTPLDREKENLRTVTLERAAGYVEAIAEGVTSASEIMHKLRRFIERGDEYGGLAASVGQARSMLESNANALDSLMTGAQIKMWDEAEFGQDLDTGELTLFSEETQAQAADLKTYLGELNDQGRVGAVVESARDAARAVAEVHAALIDSPDISQDELKARVMNAIEELDSESLKDLTVLSEALTEHAAIDLAA